MSLITNEHQELIRQQLRRILASPIFKRARRSSQLLEFLVETALAGEERNLKEYVIATSVFGRAESFDPRMDSLVRVEATRLRNRLQTYDKSASAEDRVRIVLPVGSYTPTFEARAIEEEIVESRETIGEGVLEPVQLSPARTGRKTRIQVFFILGIALLSIGAGALAVKGRLSESQFSHLTALQHLDIPGEVLLSPVLAPDSRRIFYASNRDGGRLRIWAQGLDTADARVLTPGEWESYDLDVSPDGAWLTYYSNREGGAVHQQLVSGGSEALVASLGRSPRFSPDGKQILYWIQDPHTSFGKVFSRRVRRLPEPEEPHSVAAEFDDAHNPQWTPDGRVLVCGTLRTNVPEMEHDLWVVPGTGVAPPIKTGILPFLKAREIEIHLRALKTTSFRFYNGSLIFPGIRKDRTSLYALRLSGGFRPKGEPIPLYEGANSLDNPSVRGSLLAFDSLRSNLNVWSIPLGSDGQATGKPQRLTDGTADQVLPTVSADGRRLVYLALASGGSQVWKKDLTNGVDSEVYSHLGINRIKATPDGSVAFFRVLDGPAPQLQELYAINLQGGDVRRVCLNCGSPTSVSAAGDYVVHETGSVVSRLAVLHVPSGERREFLRHPHDGVRAGRISPDARWIAFELDRGADGVQLFTAVFRGLDPIPESEWSPISDPSFSSFEPAWSPDGSSIYFLSSRSGSRDLWMQRLQPNKRALGKPTLVYQFSDPHLTPLTYHIRNSQYVGLSIAAHQAVLTLSELSSSVWVGRLTP